MMIQLRTFSRLIQRRLSPPVFYRGFVSNTSMLNMDYQVYLSTCYNIYHNLAFEDWIYENRELTNQSGLLILWRNHPCIVIGRHQNPWAECNIKASNENNVTIARRKSGGGTVYHDMGNLNCTFVTTRKMYNRHKNLKIMADALRRCYNLDVEINDRDDLLLNKKYKISGTAAKLGRKLAYHHCTLLYGVNTSQLKSLLHCDNSGLESRATESVRSDVKNLCDVDADITYDSLVEAIGTEYLVSHNTKGTIQHIDPTNERQYHGIHNLYQNLKDWAWVYGKTPKFSTSRTFPDPSQSSRNLTVVLNIEKGIITNLEMNLLDTMDDKQFPDTLEDMAPLFKEKLVGSRYWFKDVDLVLNELEFIAPSEDKKKQYEWICKCIVQML